jgi:hypothetical protein
MLYVGVGYVLINQNPNCDGHERGITTKLGENEVHFISDACIHLACSGYHLFHFSSFLPSQASERVKRKEQQSPREKQANVQYDGYISKFRLVQCTSRLTEFVFSEPYAQQSTRVDSLTGGPAQGACDLTAGPAHCTGLAITHTLKRCHLKVLEEKNNNVISKAIDTRLPLFYHRSLLHHSAWPASV